MLLFQCSTMGVVRSSQSCCAVLRRKLSSGGPTTTKQYSFYEIAGKVEPYSRALSLAGGGAVVIGGAILYVASLHRSIAVNKLEAEKKVIETEKKIIEAEKNIEVIKSQTETKIAEAEKKVAERFLLYGYAEEFNRYQTQAGISKGKEEE